MQIIQGIGLFVFARRSIVSIVTGHLWGSSNYKPWSPMASRPISRNS